MGHNCTDVSTYIDYSCPELFNADDFSHYGNTGAMCLNSAAYSHGQQKRRGGGGVHADLISGANPHSTGSSNEKRASCASRLELGAGAA